MSKRAVEELTAQMTEMRTAMALLQALVREQSEEIATLKRQVSRLEHDFAQGGSSLIDVTPRKNFSGLHDSSSLLVRSDSNSRLSHRSSNPTSPRPDLRETSSDSLRQSDSMNEAELLQTHDEFSVNVEFKKLIASCETPYLPFTESDGAIMQRKAYFDAVRVEVESLKAILMESREARKLPEYTVQGASSGSVGSDKAPLTTGGSSLSLVSSSPAATGKQGRPLSEGVDRSTTERNLSHGVTSKPHPFNSSTSTPVMTSSTGTGGGVHAGGSEKMGGSGGTAPLSRQSTATSIADVKGDGKNSKSTRSQTTTVPTSTSPGAGGTNHKDGESKSSSREIEKVGAHGTGSTTSSTQGSQQSTSSAALSSSTNSMGPAKEPSPPTVGLPSSAGSSANLEKDDDDGPATTGTLTYVTELDYQDLVEQTSGRAWPKVLNLRKMASVEENKASEKFKQQLLDLNVNMVKPGDLVFHSLLGRGSSANVYQGMLYSDAEHKGPAQEVAIKILNTSPTDLRSLLKAHKETMDELVVVQRVQSPHVVRLFGITIEPSICIVLEFCHKGSLYDVLCSDIKLNWGQCIQWFREIAIGTLALHSSEPAIVHRDLKSLNLLVDEQDKVKVADFGLSRLNEGSADQLATLSKMRGTYIYCAPEIYFGDTFTPLSDVYSIGIIFWELIVKVVTGNYQRPFGEYPAVSFGFQVVIMASRKGIRPTIPSCPDVMQKLLMSLWNSTPKQRPSCKDLLKILDVVEQEYLAHKDAWDAGQEYVPELKDVQLPPVELLGSLPVPPMSTGAVGTGAVGGVGAAASGTNRVSLPPGVALTRNLSLRAGTGSSQSGSSASLLLASRDSSSSSLNTRDSVTGKSGSGAKLRKTTKQSLPIIKGILKDKEKDKEKDKDKASKRRSTGRPKPQFEDMLSDNKVYRLMELRLQKEHSVEYLHFYRAAAFFEMRYNQRSTAENLTEAKYIETLLDSVSGDDRLIEQIKTKIANSNTDLHMFSEIQGDVTAILRTKFLALGW